MWSQVHRLCLVTVLGVVAVLAGSVVMMDSPVYAKEIVCSVTQVTAEYWGCGRTCAEATVFLSAKLQSQTSLSCRENGFCFQSLVITQACLILPDGTFKVFGHLRYSCIEVTVCP